MYPHRLATVPVLLFWLEKYYSLVMVVLLIAAAAGGIYLSREEK